MNVGCPLMVLYSTPLYESTIIFICLFCNFPLGAMMGMTSLTIMYMTFGKFMCAFLSHIPFWDKTQDLDQWAVLGTSLLHRSRCLL